MKPQHLRVLPSCDWSGQVGHPWATLGPVAVPDEVARVLILLQGCLLIAGRSACNVAPWRFGVRTSAPDHPQDSRAVDNTIEAEVRDRHLRRLLPTSTPAAWPAPVGRSLNATVSQSFPDRAIAGFLG